MWLQPICQLPDEPESIHGTITSGAPTSAGHDIMATKHDQIVMALWANYAQEHLQQNLYGN